MSVCTKGVIELKNQYVKDVLLVVNIIRQAIVDLNGKNISMDILNQSVCINFLYQKEPRLLSIWFGNEQDQFGNSIYLSFGKWGSSFSIMKFILLKFKDDFNIYFLPDDTTDDWETFRSDQWEKLTDI